MKRISPSHPTIVYIVVAALVATVLLTGGCTANGDTSGFKPEQKPSKAHLSQQIEQIKNNPKIPANIKTSAIKKLEDDMASAK